MAFTPIQYKVAIRLPTLDGGLNTKYTDVSTPLNCTPSCQDVLFDDYGAVRTTPGYEIFNTTAIANAPIDGLNTFNDPSGDKVLIAACNGSFYYQAGTTFTQIPNSTGIYTANVDVKILNVASYVIFGDGYIPVYKWDNTYFERFGSYPPQGLASGVTTASGPLNGTFSYALTYINRNNQESDYSEILTNIAVTNGYISLSDIPLAPTSYGVSSMQLYRTTANVSAVYWLVTALSAAQTSVVDANDDSTLIVPAPVDQGVPPQAKYMVYYRGRLWAAGDERAPYRLYYSEAGSIEKWQTTNFLDIEIGDGYPISAIEAFGNAIIIHKNDGKGNGTVYLLYIGDATGYSADTNWYIFKSPAAFSAVSDKSLSFFQNLLFYLGRFGCYALSGQDLARTSADSDAGRFQTNNLAYDIDTDVKTWNSALLPKAASVMYDNKIWLAVPATSSSSNNTKIYIYDFVRMSADKLGMWTKLSAPAVNNFVVSDGILYGGGYNGYVFKMATGTSFDGAAIQPYYWTAAVSGNPEHRDNTKVFRILYITHECPGSWLLYVDYEVDFNGVLTTGTVSLSPGGSLWGVMQWVNSTWGGGTTTKRSRLILQNAVGKLIKFKFYVTGLNETFRVKELEIEYNVRTKRG